MSTITLLSLNLELGGGPDEGCRLPDRFHRTMAFMDSRQANLIPCQELTFFRDDGCARPHTAKDILGMRGVLGPPAPGRHPTGIFVRWSSPEITDRAHVAARTNLRRDSTRESCTYVDRALLTAGLHDPARYAAPSMVFWCWRIPGGTPITLPDPAPGEEQPELDDYRWVGVSQLDGVCAPYQARRIRAAHQAGHSPTAPWPNSSAVTTPTPSSDRGPRPGRGTDGRPIVSTRSIPIRTVEILVRVLRALPLLALHVPAAAGAFYAYTLTSQGGWDESTLTGIETGCFVTVVCAAAALVPLLVRALRGSPAWWWPAPAAALLLAGTARWVFIATAYP